MTKFRSLSTEELRPLKKEFITFLSANTITGKDWALIKKNKPKEAEKIIDLFSDSVWQTTLDKICCLERREEKQLCIFLCEKDKIRLVGFSINIKNDTSLLDPETFNKLASGELTLSSLKASFYTSEKKYRVSRSKDLFLMIESGCVPCKKEFFYGLLSLTKSTEK